MARAKVIYEGVIEILDFQASAVKTFRVSDEISLRSSTYGRSGLGNQFHPSGVAVTVTVKNDGEVRIAREEVVSEKLLAPGILGVFSLFKRSGHEALVLTAVRDSEWWRHLAVLARTGPVGNPEFDRVLRELS